jgi:hypothetical protein
MHVQVPEYNQPYSLLKGMGHQMDWAIFDMYGLIYA